MNIDIEALLQPISAETMCGEDLSFSNEFHEIKKARTQDDPLLDQGDWVSEPKQADWGFVSNKIIDLMSHRSKDIRLLTWLTEAWSHLYGFEGLAKAIELSYRLLEQYWLKIHPELEDDDLDQRLGLLQGLLNQLPTLVRSVPLIDRQPFYTLLDYENFLYQQNNRRKNAEDSNEIEHSNALDDFEQLLASTAKSFQKQQYQNFQLFLEQWEIIKQVLDQLMELEAPSFAQIDSQFESIQLNLKKIYKVDTQNSSLSNMPIQPEISGNTACDTDAAKIQASVQAIESTLPTFQANTQNHIQNRQQAMQILSEISHYFQINEPYSPVSYMLKKTIKWSQIPLHEWLSQVIKHDNPLENIQELLGVSENNED